MKSYDEMLLGMLAVARGALTAAQLEEADAHIRGLGETGHRAALDRVLVDKGFLTSDSAAELIRLRDDLCTDPEYLTGRLVVEETLITVGEVEQALQTMQRRDDSPSLIDVLKERRVLTSDEAEAIQRKAIAKLAQAAKRVSTGEVQAAPGAPSYGIAPPEPPPAPSSTPSTPAAPAAAPAPAPAPTGPPPSSSSLSVDAISSADLTAAGELRLEAGSRFGPYVLEEEIARGGMGIIFRAKHLNLGRIVAVKTLSHAFNANQTLVKRFIQEAKALARLMHPNIVQVFNVGKIVDTYFLEMEFVDGEDLHDKIAREAPLLLEEACDIVKQVIAALKAASAKGIVHRDVKPENILIHPEGYAKLTDFGIVKMGDTSAQTGTRTRLGEVIGTPYYISPEQARGEEGVDFRADIYSLGATFWRMLTGRPPFEGRNAMDVIAKHLHRELPSLEDLDELEIRMADEVHAVLVRMMAKSPDDRYQSWDEVTQAIDDLDRIGGCENCGSPMEVDHIICIECGYNRTTGVQLQTKFGSKRPQVQRTRSASQKVAGRQGGGRRGRRSGGRAGARRGGSRSGPSKATGSKSAGGKSSGGKSGESGSKSSGTGGSGSSGKSGGSSPTPRKRRRRRRR